MAFDLSPVATRGSTGDVAFPHNRPAIHLTVPVADDPGPIIRGLVGRAARRAGFTYDGIEDFALAVDEAVLLLLETSPAEIRLQLHTLDGVSGLGATLTTDGATKSLSLPDLRADYRWDVLETLCHEVAMFDAGGSIVLSQPAR